MRLPRTSQLFIEGGQRCPHLGSEPQVGSVLGGELVLHGKCKDGRWFDRMELHAHLAKQPQAIGGNVRNSVSRTVLTLSPDGYLQYSRPRPWFLIIENRLD